MKPFVFPPLRFLSLLLTLVFLTLTGAGRLYAQGSTEDRVATVRLVQGTVEVLRAGAGTWDSARTNQVLFHGDGLRTGEHSRAALELNDGSIVHLGELFQGRLEAAGRRKRFDLVRGVLNFFHRDEPDTLEVRAEGAVAIVRGTEFTFRAEPDGTVEITLFDGEVTLANDLGEVTLSSGERGSVRPGEAPTKTAVIEGGTTESVQWLLYYPAVLNPAELPLTARTRRELKAALEHYGEGDLLRALAALPTAWRPTDDAERALFAGLLLAVGRVDEAERRLAEISPASPEAAHAAALRQVIAATRLQPEPAESVREPSLASGWLADSYARQSKADLEGALTAARAAASEDAGFGFAWARVAELEFSFGRIGAARTALTRALELTPRNAQALALRGFLLAAEHRLEAARESFDHALSVDAALGNAWLGRGLVRLRSGDPAGGRADLMMAAAREPQRALLRAYLGKAWAETREPGRARHELDLARQLDPLDPTAWLYSALLHQQGNRINDALRDYAAAAARNDGRALYRSRLLLDQDRAVVGANRAAALRDAGFTELARREAGRAVAADASNPAAHLFLAESHLNSERANLRYETPRVSEYLQANLLAPVGGGVLSAGLSQQDYARLFERDGSHVFSQTEYRSEGTWSQSAGVFGSHGRFGYLVDGFFTSGRGDASNTDFELAGADVQWKQQVSPRDTFYAQALMSELEGGDLAVRANPQDREPSLRVRETLEPLLLAGWHRAWNPEHHTLFLAGWLRGELTRELPASANANVWTIRPPPPFASLSRSFLPQFYESDSEFVSGEVQHLWQTGDHQFIAGVRGQHGWFDTRNEFTGLATNRGPALVAVSPQMSRAQLYAYDTWQALPRLAVTAGLSYDWLESPRNFRSAPLSEETDTASRLSPKLGFVWTVATNTYLRAAYTRSLGGVSYEQSFRLEPTQVAGFNQAFRSLIPESLVGSLSGTRFETWHASLETRLVTGTTLAVQAEILNSRADRAQGVFEGAQTAGGPVFLPGTLTERLDYTERTAAMFVEQLLGRDFALAASYRFTMAELDRAWADIPPGVSFGAVPLQASTRADLHQLTFGLRFNHPAGWFAGAEVAAWWQNSRGAQATPAQTVWQGSLLTGYRFLQRRAELAVGLENLGDAEHQLNPLGLSFAPPRQRTLVARLKWVF